MTAWSSTRNQWFASRQTAAHLRNMASALSGAATVASAVDPDEVDYRRRLQRALGNDYELRGLIGRGGFGAIYAVWDRRLERDLAVKALRHDVFATRAVLERFQREAKAVAKLRHPNILPVYSVGEGEGIAFMLMPFIRGESLGAVLKRGERVSLDASIRIGIEMARALADAHRLGIVHRDVKPENIMLEGEDRHALLADFGIAKAGAPEGELTGTGVAIGTPQYMSPEQAAGERDVDARSDVYSLGAAIFEMIAGRRVYQAETYQQFLVQQFTTEPPRLADLVPTVPAALSDAIMRALSRERDSRWSSASEFAEALAAASPRQELPSSSAESWFASNALLALSVLLLSYYVDVAAFIALAGDNSTRMRTAVEMFRIPLKFVFNFGLLLIIVGLIGTIARARRSTHSWKAVGRAVFGQPTWWQAWYPRSWRHPRSIWDQMSLPIKTLRTVFWVLLIFTPIAIPLLIFVPAIARLSASVDLALPFPIRVAHLSLDFLRYPLTIAFGAVVVGIVIMSMRSRVSPFLLIRLLLTFDRDDWSSPAARRMLVTT